MSAWTRQDPGAGDVAGLRRQAAEHERTSTMLAEAYALMRTHQGNVTSAVWSGAAAEAFRDGIEQFCTRVRSVVEPIAWCAAELRVYAGTVERIAEDAHGVRARRDTALEDRRAAQAVLNRAPRPGEVIDASTITRASAQVAEADRTLAAVDRDLDRLSEERAAADARVRGALVLEAVPSWDTVAVALQTAGITSAEHLTWRGLRTSLVDLARRVADGERGATDELATLLATWGTSASIMGSFLRDLGGRDLADLLTAVDAQALRDPARAEAAGAVQDALRRALALGAGTWDADQRTAFAAGLLTGTDATLVVSYLFADVEGAPMPPGLICATLDAIQARERDGMLIWQVDPAAGGVGPMADGLLAPLGDGSPSWFVDPAAVLLRQAAGCPVDVTAWLAEDAARAQHWYGQRDWPAAGGWAAPLVLWEALQTVPGALVGPGADPASVDRLVAANVAIITAWMNDPERHLTRLDAEAADALAGVVERQLPLWLETVLTADEDRSDDANHTHAPIMWMGADGAGNSVLVSDRALATLLALVAQDADAAARLTASTATLQVVLVDSLGANPVIGQNEILDRVAALLGTVDGAQVAAELTAASLHDAAVRQQIGLGGLVSGEVLGRIAGDAGIAASVVTTVGEDLAENAWASSYDTALRDFLAEAGATGERETAARRVLTALAEGWAPAEEIEAAGGLDHYVDKRMDEYDDERDALDLTKTDAAGS
jgi:uncharacterized protein YukE